MSPVEIIIAIAVAIGSLLLLYFILGVVFFAVGQRQVKNFAKEASRDFNSRDEFPRINTVDRHRPRGRNQF